MSCREPAPPIRPPLPLPLPRCDRCRRVFLPNQPGMRFVNPETGAVERRLCFPCFEIEVPENER